jgi:hypothetical protein
MDQTKTIVLNVLIVYIYSTVNVLIVMIHVILASAQPLTTVFHAPKTWSCGKINVGLLILHAIHLV